MSDEPKFGGFYGFTEIELTDAEKANEFALRTRMSGSTKYVENPVEGESFVDLFDRDGIYLCSVASAGNVEEMNKQLKGLRSAITMFLGE